MKAILILILTVGSQGDLDRADSALNVREIPFASLQACERAADRLTRSGRRASDYAKTFSTTGSLSGGLFVSPPVVIAECVEVE